MGRRGNTERLPPRWGPTPASAPASLWWTPPGGSQWGGNSEGGKRKGLHQGNGAQNHPAGVGLESWLLRALGSHMGIPPNLSIRGQREGRKLSNTETSPQSRSSPHVVGHFPWRNFYEKKKITGGKKKPPFKAGISGVKEHSRTRIKLWRTISRFSREKSPATKRQPNLSLECCIPAHFSLWSQKQAVVTTSASW